MLPWLFPLWMLAAVASISISGVLAIALALLSGLVVFPFLAGYIRAHTRPPDGAWSDLEVDYWRIRRL